ncbi:MAG TPA: OmpA family protein, partial [Polyangiaceae bacterium]|nr:OmpA family protein [Polyangiaceae bacterium]
LEAWAIVDNTSGEDWNDVKLGVGSSSALSFRYDLQSVRIVERETLQQNDLFAYAPPTGGATYGAHEKKLVADLDDATLAAVDGEPDFQDEVALGAVTKKPSTTPGHASPRGGGASGDAAHGAGRGFSAAAGGVAQAAPAQEPRTAPNAQVAQLARSLQGAQNQIVIEGYAKAEDKDKQAASLERANKMREQLLRNGVDPNKVVAVGRGEQVGRTGGVRIVEAPPPDASGAKNGKEAKAQAGADAVAEPIGTSSFESGNVTSVRRGTSAMVSILDGQTEGEVVYLYDPESARGNGQFPFKSVRLKNPSDSALETGPVTVFGEGRFIGEGMAEPIPARAVAFVPFALDRQIVVDKQTGDSDEIARILTVQRGVFSTEVQHKRKTTFTLNNRLGDRAVVYVRHTVAQGYKLSKVPEGAGEEKLGAANLFRVVVPAHGKVDVAIEETTPVFKTIDVRTPEGIEQVRVFLSRTAAEGPLQKQVQDLLKLNKQMADIEQRIATTREQMGEYRERMDELHNQIFTLKAVKTAGPLMVSLEKKMQEVSDKLSKATIDIVSQQEALMVARVHFQDGVADLTLEKKDDTKPELAKAPK